MIDQARLDKIKQIKLDALCGKILHTAALPRLRRKNDLIDYLGFFVPIVLLIGTVVVLRLHVPELAFVVIADIAGGALLLVTILKLSYRWPQRIERHLDLMGQNLGLIRDADSLLNRHKTASAEAADAFILKASEIEKLDLDVFGRIPQLQQQETYRLALRELGKDIHCDCGASPWQFSPGNCGKCGGTPVSSGVKTDGKKGK